MAHPGFSRKIKAFKRHIRRFVGDISCEAADVICYSKLYRQSNIHDEGLIYLLNIQNSFITIYDFFQNN